MKKTALTLAAVLIALAMLPAVSLWPPARTAHAQGQAYHLARFDSDITVNKDGSLDVVETIVYVFDAGSFHFGTRSIPLKRVDDISNVHVAEVVNGKPVQYQPTSYDPNDPSTDVPNTYAATREGGQANIRWVFNYTSNTSKTFQLSYHAAGAVQVYSDRDVFDWNAVPDDHSASIYSSTATVRLPPGTDTSNLITSSLPLASSLKQGNSIAWTTSGVDNGFEVGVQIPKGALSAAIPSWQNYQDNVRPLVNLAMLVLGLLVLIVGLLLAMLRWYSKGRDKPVKLISDYLTTPPSNLPPGLVGTLIDESADVRDVIATIVDQGRKGNLTIRELEGNGKDFEYTQTGSKVDFRYEQMALDALFKQGSTVRLSELKNHFYSDLPPIFNEMYNSLVALKYFPDNPKSVRGRNIALGIALIAAGAALFFFVGLPLTDNVSSLAIVPPISLGIVGLVWAALSRAMPRKTDLGAEETARWRAFERYLQEMQHYTNVQAAADKFQQYLPYAVAMGVERQLINQFNSVPSAMPQWYAPYGYYPYGYFPIGAATRQATGQQAVGVGGGGGQTPQFDPGAAVQGMSDSIASAMQGMSDSFTSMVNAASSALTSSPSSSGSGGWGGGGGSFGGGGGGGGSVGAG